MIISILNSRIGPNERQIDAFKRLLPKFNPQNDTFQHGADQTDLSINSILKTIGFNVNTYPHDKIKVQIVFNNVTANEPLPLIKRNIAMVDSADIIVAIPQYMNENEDSPQWKTIRSAIFKNKKIYVISPAGYTFELVK